MPRDLFRVYVDEAGDRGWGGRSSPTFVLSAVMIPDSERAALKAMRDGICTDLGKPTSTVLHWADNVKQHSQRKHVARRLAGSSATITNVVVMKQPMIGSGTALSDPAAMYNYAVRRLLERVSWHVDERGGEAIVTFAHVRRFPYWKLKDYLKYLQAIGPPEIQIRWDAIRRVRINQPNRVRLLQVADLAAGCLYAATNPDDYGDFEPSYLLELAPRIYVRGRARVESYGMNVVGPDGCMASAYPWWSDFKAACENRVRV